MKSRMFTLGIAAAATLVALVLASVGGATNQATVKVADVTDVGGLNDKGFNHLSYVGLVKAEKQLGIQGRVYISNTAADRKPNLQAAAQAGYGLVVGVGVNFQFGPLDAVAPASVSRTATSVCTGTVCPSWTLISARTPAVGAGISASTLSVEISNSGSSRFTGSPTFLSHLLNVPSAIDSPIWGMRTSTLAMIPH